MVITLDFTNNSDEKASFFWSVYCEAFQDDEELDTAIIFTDYENWEMITDDQAEEIRPGKTIEVCLAYVLENLKEDVVLNLETMDLVVKEKDKAQIEIDLRDLDREEPKGPKGTEPTAKSDSDTVVLGDYTITYLDACIMQDSDGKDAIVLTLEFANNSEDSTAYAYSVMETAYQDGVAIDPATVYINEEDWDQVTDQQYTKIKPGKTIEVQSAFVLDDPEGEVEVEFEDLYTDKKGAVTIDPTTLDRVGSGNADGPSDDALLDFWNGQWYGWWAMSGGCTGDYEDLNGSWWDACAEIGIESDYTGTLKFWDEDFSRDDLIGTVEISLTAVGTGPHGTVMSEGGNFWGASIGHADWIVDPALADYENTLWIGGSYEGDEGTFDYVMYLKPWGERWDDVEAASPDDLPYHYADWYLPLVEAGMPIF